MNNMNNNVRLGEHYQRYSNYSIEPSEFSNYNKNIINYENKDFNDLSVRQEPEPRYLTQQHFVAIASSSRDTVKYPNPSNYVLELPYEYKNVVSVELIDATFPDKNNITQEPFLILDIEQLRDVISSNNTSLSNAFAILKMNAPVASGYFITMDKCCWEKMPKIFKQKGASLKKLNIKIKKTDGSLFNFNAPTPEDALYQHTFFFRIVTSQPDINVINSRNVY